nr:DUF397 domain-containing protein [Nocardiopsis valliformis]
MRHKVTFDEAEQMGWRKSSYSGGGGGNCVEIGWHKSSYSGSGGGNCVEVAEGQKVLVRDTQHRERGYLSFQGGEWSSLLSTLKR